MSGSMARQCRQPLGTLLSMRTMAGCRVRALAPVHPRLLAVVGLAWGGPPLACPAHLRCAAHQLRVQGSRRRPLPGHRLAVRLHIRLRLHRRLHQQCPYRQHHRQLELQQQRQQEGEKAAARRSGRLSPSLLGILRACESTQIMVMVMAMTSIMLPVLVQAVQVDTAGLLRIRLAMAAQEEQPAVLQAAGAAEAPALPRRLQPVLQAQAAASALVDQHLVVHSTAQQQEVQRLQRQQACRQRACTATSLQSTLHAASCPMRLRLPCACAMTAAPVAMCE